MLGYGLLPLLLLFTPSDGSVLAVSTKLMLVLLLEWWLRGQRVPPGRLSLDEAVVHLVQTTRPVSPQIGRAHV